MIEDIYFTTCSNESFRNVVAIKQFLKSIDIEFSEDIECFVVAKQRGEIVACGGVAKNVLKCIGIVPRLRGEGFVLSLMSELIKLAYTMGQEDLFLFSRAKNRHFFQDCGFWLVEELEGEVVLMENNHNLKSYKESLKLLRKDFEKVGSIVMNANPFTLGHQYLVQKASKKCDWLHLFVVKEDVSEFSYEDRLKLIKRGLKHISNITIHEGSDYIISRATFPTYFLKESENINSIYSRLDAKIFKNHIIEPLGITHRFVGEEPYCVLTREYNEQLKKELPIKVVEIKRKEEEGRAISASRVREFLKQEDFENLKRLVPLSTYEFLVKNRQKKEQKA